MHRIISALNNYVIHYFTENTQKLKQKYRTIKYFKLINIFAQQILCLLKLSALCIWNVIFTGPVQSKRPNY